MPLLVNDVTLKVAKFGPPLIFFLATPLSQDKNLQFQLVEDPFSMDPEEVPIQLQLKVIELQASRFCARLNAEEAAC